MDALTPRPPKAKILITLREDGAVSVEGCIGEKVLAYGLLEIARDVIQNYKVDPSQILVPNRLS